MWFEDLGGFTKEQNIPLFVEWSVFMFRRYGRRIRLWSTFNEPSVREGRFEGNGWVVLIRTPVVRGLCIPSLPGQRSPNKHI